MVSIGMRDPEPNVSKAMLGADIGELQVTVKVPEFAMVALVSSAGTMAGDQLAAVFQLPLEAAAQDVCARLVSHAPNMTASKMICAGLYPAIFMNKIP